MQNERSRVEDMGEERAVKEQSWEKKEKTFDDQYHNQRHPGIDIQRRKRTKTFVQTTDVLLQWNGGWKQSEVLQLSESRQGMRRSTA